MEALRVQGNVPVPVSHEFVRELTEADLPLLAENRGSKPVSIVRLRDSHHALARALASGMSGSEASITTGYTVGRIAVLKMDPAFSQLVEEYRGQRKLAEANATERISTLKLDFLEELRTRLDENPSTFSNRETLDCFRELADRSGNGPTKSVNLNQTVVTMQDLLELSKGLHDDAGVTILESRPVDSGSQVGHTQRLVSMAEVEVEVAPAAGDQLSEPRREASKLDEQNGGTTGGAP